MTKSTRLAWNASLVFAAIIGSLLVVKAVVSQPESQQIKTHRTTDF